MVRAGTYNNQVKPSIPYVEYTGAVCPYVSVSPLWNTLKFSIVKVITSDFIDEDSSTEEGIQVLTTGLYRIDFELCLDNRNCNGDTLVMTRVIKGGGNNPYYEARTTGEIETSGSCGSSSGVIQLNSSVTVYLLKGERVYFQFRTADADTEIMTDYESEGDWYRQFSRVRISFIPMGGWNNNNCGNVINRGVRR